MQKELEELNEQMFQCVQLVKEKNDELYKIDKQYNNLECQLSLLDNEIEVNIETKNQLERDI